jgi:spore germination protein (amino acid permease)
MSKANEITSKQLMCFTVAAQIGTGILFLPSELANRVGHDGWISVVIAGSLALLFNFLIVLLLKQHERKSIFDINISLLGKHLGAIINLIILAYLIFAAAIIGRVFLEIVSITVLRTTPQGILLIFISISTMYLTLKGLKNVSRYSAFLFFNFIMVLIYFYLIRKDIKGTFLLPVGKVGGVDLIKSVPLTFYSFIGFELTAIVYPYVKDKEKVLKYSSIGILFTTLFFTAVVLVSTGIFGEIRLKNIVFSLFSIAQSRKIPIIERIDLFFILIWIPPMERAYGNFYFAAYDSMLGLFNLKSSKLIIGLFTLVIVFIAKHPPDFLEVERFKNILGIFGGVVTSYFVLCCVLSYMKRKGVGGL